MNPVLVLGLDGATFEVIHPLIESGRLPNLARLMAEGAHAPLASTVPPMTFPSWSSFLTGLGPGRHGVFDFTQKRPGEYRIRFSNATDRAGASIFARASQAGGRVLALGMPATFPPEPLDGLLVCGFDAPVSTGTDASMASDPALYRSVAERTGPWMAPDLDESAAGDGFHEQAARVLVDRVKRKTRFALEALSQLRAAGRGPELLTIVYSESDTVCHHFWRDHDPDSPRHDPTASAERRNAIADVYEALDTACGELRAAFGEDAACVVVSDHGAGGAGRHVVHLNGYLAECGLLARRPRGALDGLARNARDAALRVLPPAAAQAIFRRMRPAAARIESTARFGGFDWSKTALFSEEANTQPGLWLNQRGREAEGCVAAADRERVLDEATGALLEWKLPDGGPVVARARRREEVYEGPFVDRAPDIVIELALDAGYGLSLVATPWHDDPRPLRRLADDELAGGRGRGMNGVHRPHGVWIAAGPEATADAPREASIIDAAPTIAGLLGIPWDGSLDGQRLDRPQDYSPEQEALVAERLRQLGYLE